MKKKKELLYDLNDKPPILTWIMLSFQHLFAMFSATILAAITINKGCGEEVISPGMALITSGIGTLLYILVTKKKSPMYLGSSFSYVPPVIAAFLIGGKPAAFTGIICVGIIYCIVAFIIKFTGSKWINKLLPDIVVGPMIMIIGLALAPTAVEQIGLIGDTINYKEIIVAIVTFLITALVAIKGKGFIKVIPFLIGIIGGYILSIILGIVDFSPLAGAKLFELPNFYILFKDYHLDFSAFWTLAPITLVSISEHIGDHKVLGTIIQKDLIEDPGLDKTLLGDGLAGVAAGIIGGPANTSYGENTSVVGMTKVASIHVLILAAIMAILLGFSGVLIALVETVPDCVIGGVGILLYGFISVNGFKILVDNQVDFSDTRNVIISSTMLVLGLGGATITLSTGIMSATFSGMALSALVGVLINILLPKETK